MSENRLPPLLKDSVASDIGPTAKELMLEQIEKEYNNGNQLNSLFYQVRTLHQTFQERYYQVVTNAADKNDHKSAIAQLLEQMNDWEREDIKSNPLMQYVVKSLKESEDCEMVQALEESNIRSCNFLQNVTDPLEGVRKIEEICTQFPEEWNILQLCKGPRTETTYSIYPQIHERDAAIYLTVLRHARSKEYPTPICLRFNGTLQAEIFRKFACIANRFKENINIDPKTCNTTEAKKQYWDVLSELNQFISNAIADLKSFIYPWKFLFAGKHLNKSNRSIVLRTVDEFCDEYHWETNERVLLSLAALHINLLSEYEIRGICKELMCSEEEQVDAITLLLKLQSSAPVDCLAKSSENTSKNYPCILIVDECLDHFFWEELNVHQEFCRVNSLQGLWRLFQFYKDRIKHGYLTVNITNGGCMINPDGNLPKTELRMRQFFEYWTPHWLMKFSQKPTQDELLKDYFKRTCYVYAGHGSGLQYINGKHIAKQQIDCVVFLFGCDSSRLRSNGLYSELVGPHLYYHAAMCPTLVGTLMPALDANMDNIAADILSRWIAPKSKEVLPWHEIDRTAWIKKGEIKYKNSSTEDKPIAVKAAKPQPSVGCTRDYHMGSLCAILARVHQGKVETKFYNTVSYVCRGLPVWNCDVQPLPE